MLKWFLNSKWKWLSRNWSDYFNDLLLIVAIAGMLLVVFIIHLFHKNSGWQDAFVAAGTMILAIAAFAQIRSQISNQKNRQKCIYNIFIERINVWIDIIDNAYEDILKTMLESPLAPTFAQAVTLAAYEKAKSDSTGIVMTQESKKVLQEAINKVKVNESLKPSYTQLNILKRSEEYQILLKEGGLLKPESLIELIRLFDYIYIFNLKIDELNNENDEQKQIYIICQAPLFKVLCIKCLFYFFREANLEKKNKKIIEKHKKYMKDFYNKFKSKNIADLEYVCQEIKKISDEFYIEGLDNN